MNFVSTVYNIIKNVCLKTIRFYQYFLSIDQSFWGKHTGIKVCKHYPYCSEYTYQAIDKHGVGKGTLMGCARILRCNGFFKGGIDPVPDHFSLRKNKINS